MEVISIERSTYEELLTSFNSFVIKMKEMASRGNDKGFFANKANKFDSNDFYGIVIILADLHLKKH